MPNCMHPLDGILAFLGAIGFIFALFGIIIGIGQWMMEGEKNKKSGTLPGMLKVGFIGGLLLVVVIILAFINQALPVICR